VADGTLAQQQGIIANGHALAERLGASSGGELRELLLGILIRVTLGETDVRIDMNGASLRLAPPTETAPKAEAADEGRHGERKPSSLMAHNGPIPSARAAAAITIRVPVVLRRRGVETKLVIEGPAGTGTPQQPDPALIKMIAHAHRWRDDLVANRFPTVRALAHAYGKDERYVARLLPLACLAPTIVEAILAGRHPVDLTAQDLITLPDLPIEWSGQKAALEF
jgi:hypothetical protein